MLRSIGTEFTLDSLIRRYLPTDDGSVWTFVTFELGGLEDPAKVGEVLRRIYRTLDADDFDGLTWEKRKLRFEQVMDELITVYGLIVSLFRT